MFHVKQCYCYRIDFGYMNAVGEVYKRYQYVAAENVIGYGVSAWKEVAVLTKEGFVWLPNPPYTRPKQ